jgi:5-oxoprolinase (ATP-hydrolysing) subunit A
MLAAMRTIDINSDLGESFGNWRMGNDEALIPEITSANVACGFHASDPVTMLRTVETCKANGVAVGAHPGFPDLLGFGRRVMAISPEDCYAYVVYQAGALQGACSLHSLALHHVKPHGAFYTVLNGSEELADAFAEAVAAMMPEPVVYWPAKPEAALPVAARKRGVRVVMELYVDLEYAPDGTLIIQRQKVPADLGRVAEQVRRWLEDGQVEAVDGSRLPIEADSICVHGDGPNVLDVVRTVRRTIEEAGHAVGPLATARVAA